MSHHVHIRSARRLIPVIQLHTRPVVICLQSLSLNQIRCDDSSGTMSFTKISALYKFRVPIRMRSCPVIFLLKRAAVVALILTYNLTAEFHLCCADDADTAGLISDCYRLQSHIATTTDQHARRAMAALCQHSVPSNNFEMA